MTLRRQKFSVARLALSPGDVWITYRLSRDLYSAGQRSQRGYPDAPACQPETV